mgnify:CR=1 FL=1
MIPRHTEYDNFNTKCNLDEDPEERGGKVGRWACGTVDLKLSEIFKVVVG